LLYMQDGLRISGRYATEILQIETEIFRMAMVLTSQRMREFSYYKRKVIIVKDSHKVTTKPSNLTVININYTVRARTMLKHTRFGRMRIDRKQRNLLVL
jgi:hypothetical protein